MDLHDKTPLEMKSKFSSVKILRLCFLIQVSSGEGLKYLDLTGKEKPQIGFCHHAPRKCHKAR